MGSARPGTRSSADLGGTPTRASRRSSRERRLRFDDSPLWSLAANPAAGLPARGLPPRTWLKVNVSPQLLGRGADPGPGPVLSRRCRLCQPVPIYQQKTRSADERRLRGYQPEPPVGPSQMRMRAVVAAPIAIMITATWRKQSANNGAVRLVLQMLAGWRSATREDNPGSDPAARSYWLASAEIPVRLADSTGPPPALQLRFPGKVGATFL